MNLNYITKKKHIFKRRVCRNIKRLYKLNVGNTGLFSLKNQFFELVYWRGFKKIIRRRHLKLKMKFKRKKFWIFLKPNVIFTSKSVNSRMGAGVGKFIRLAIKLKSYRSFVEFRHYSPAWLKKMYSRTRYRYPIKFLVYSKK